MQYGQTPRTPRSRVNRVLWGRPRLLSVHRHTITPLSIWAKLRLHGHLFAIMAAAIHLSFELRASSSAHELVGNLEDPLLPAIENRLRKRPRGRQ